jgi:hypothetical protein
MSVKTLNSPTDKSAKKKKKRYERRHKDAYYNTFPFISILSASDINSYFYDVLALAE